MSEVFRKTLVHGGSVRSFQIRRAQSVGWESFERGDERAVHQQLLTDWHRVERELARFRREVAELERQGWRDVP
jgi:hypothetical protein